MAIDIVDAYTNQPPPLDFVLPGFLAGTVGSIFSAGGSGKSMMTLEAAMAISCSVAGGDLLQINPPATGRVIYFAGEDPEVVLRHRIHDMTENMDERAVHAIADRLDLEPMLGVGLDLFRDDHMERVIAYAAESRLIVLDTISRFHSGDENSNGEMGQLLNRLEKIAVRTGAAVLFLHHVSKSSGRDGSDTGQHASRGASVLTDNARWGASIRRMTPEEAEAFTDRPYERAPIGEESRGFFVRMDVPKNNYGPPVETHWYRRGRGGVLQPVELQSVKKSSNGKTKTKRADEKTGQNQAPGEDPDVW